MQNTYYPVLHICKCRKPMSRSNLQLTTAEIEEAIERHDDVDHPDANTVEDVVDALDAINADIINHLDLHEDAIDDGAHEIVHEDKDVVVLADSGHFWNEQFDAMDGFDDEILQTIVINLHHVAARNACEHSWSVSDPVVIDKPAVFAQGEQHALREIARRTDELGSVARAVDTLATENHGLKQSVWANLTGRNESTVSRTTDN